MPAGRLLKMPRKKRRTDERIDIKDYSSDGLSFDADDDNDLPCIRTSPKKERSFAKDDVVWAPYGDIYWPAVITSLKGSSACFLWVNERRGRTAVYKTKLKRLLDFDDETRNSELKRLGENKFSDFRNAYDQVTKYFVVKCTSAIKTLSARRFLTLSETDGLPALKDTLYRMGCEIKDVDPVNIESHLGDNEYAAESEEEIDSETIDLDEFQKELLSLPGIEDQVLVALREDAEKLLHCISSNDCADYIKGIKEGTVESERHRLYPHPGLTSISGLGPFTMHNTLRTKLLDLVENIYEQLNISDLDYRLQVVLPEVIIFGYMKLKTIDKQTASDCFLEASSIVGKRLSSS